MAPVKLTKLQKYIMDLFILLYHYDYMIKSILSLFLGTLSIAVTFNTETLFTVDAQPSIENSSNLTYPNNPTLLGFGGTLEDIHMGLIKYFFILIS